jgi:SH3-like domain-containing protein
MIKTAKKRTAANSAASSSSRPKPRKVRQKGNRVAAARSGTKQSAAIEMLRSPSGATLAALTKATGWRSHSVRGFLAGVVRKRLKLDLKSAVVEGARVYRITGEHGARHVEMKPDDRKS